MTTLGNQNKSLEESLSEYAKELVAEQSNKIKISIGSKVNTRTALILEKIAHTSGKEKGEIAGEILEKAIEIVYKQLEGKIEVTEEEIIKKGKEIEASNKRKGKKVKTD